MRIRHSAYQVETVPNDGDLWASRHMDGFHVEIIALSTLSQSSCSPLFKLLAHLFFQVQIRLFSSSSITPRVCSWEEIIPRPASKWVPMAMISISSFRNAGTGASSSRSCILCFFQHLTISRRSSQYWFFHSGRLECDYLDFEVHYEAQNVCAYVH